MGVSLSELHVCQYFKVCRQLQNRPLVANLRNHDAATLKSAASETEEAYKNSVDFFKTEINIPSDSVIPYQNQIVVLTEIFRLLPRPTADQFSEIKKLFWRTTLSGYFAGWNTGNMGTDLKSIQAFGKGDIKTIEFTYLKPRSDIWSKKVFRVNNAHAKALAITMGYFKPIDILNGQNIDVSKALAWTNAKEYHHFFPKAFLKSIGVHYTKINCLANIIYLTLSSNKIISDRKPSEYLIDVERAAGSNLSAWLPEQNSLKLKENHNKMRINNQYYYKVIQASKGIKNLKLPTLNLYLRHNAISSWLINSNNGFRGRWSLSLRSQPSTSSKKPLMAR